MWNSCTWAVSLPRDAGPKTSSQISDFDALPDCGPKPRNLLGLCAPAGGTGHSSRDNKGLDRARAP
jgi:hypothetical protein